jgi:hypothetical protein
MVDNILYETLDRLAERFIPEGRHKLLHVNSRELWIELMVSLIENEAIDKKLSIITKCAVNWEYLLVQKLSTQN